MRIISKRQLRLFWEKHPQAENALMTWYTRASHANWHSFAGLRRAYPTADLVGRLTIFNIGGNNFRLIVRVEYKRQEIYIRHVLTHAEYDKGNCKDDPWF